MVLVILVFLLPRFCFGRVRGEYAGIFGVLVLSPLQAQSFGTRSPRVLNVVLCSGLLRRRPFASGASGLSFRRPLCGLKLEGDGDLGFTAFTLG